MSSSRPHVVIIGGGIIGLCTAYYLLTGPEPPRVTIVENTHIAAASSSKAAGFVGGNKGWHAPANVELAKLSFDAITDLAAKLDGASSFGWRLITTTGVKVGNQDKMSGYRTLPVADAVDATSGIGGWANGEKVVLINEDTGVMLPGAFCARIWAECTAKGLATLIATPTGRVGKTLNTTEGALQFDKLLLAAGPWTADVCETLGLSRVPISSLPGHHIQIKPALPEGMHVLPDESLFCGIGAGDANILESIASDIPDYEEGSWERTQGWSRTVEFFPRADGNVYAAGENGIPKTIGDRAADARLNRLPPTAARCRAHVDDELVARLVRAAKAVSPALDIEKGAKLVEADLCYRPVTPDKCPIIGEWAEDIFVSSGHGPWGITLSAGSGIVMAELLRADLAHRKPQLSADISLLQPHRFEPKRAAKL